jgi:hypothetical protein
MKILMRPIIVLGLIVIMGACGSEAPAVSDVTSEGEVAGTSPLELRIEALEKTLSEANTRLTAVSDIVECYRMRDRLIDAWSRHKPIAGKCNVNGRGRCRETGLRPNTLGRYRSRLKSLQNSLRGKPEAIAERFAKLGAPPTPPAERWWARQSFTQETYLRLRGEADDATTNFVQQCAEAIWSRKVEMPPLVDPDGEPKTATEGAGAK